jgi:hypothetical protein
LRIDNYLIIDTEAEAKREQVFSVSKSNNSTKFITVSDFNTGEKIPFYNFYLLDYEEKRTFGTAANINGKAIIPQNKETKK